MGKLIKNHWARLIILAAAACKFTHVHALLQIHTNTSEDQIAAAIEGFFWPKIFWDFLTRTLDGAVKPIPVLQIINLLFGIGMFALEWPLSFLAGSTIHRSLEIRLAILPLVALAAILMYQTTNPAIYYMIGMVVYFVAYSEGEVSSLLLSGPESMLIWYRLFVPVHGHYPNVVAPDQAPKHERDSAGHDEDHLFLLFVNM